MNFSPSPQRHKFKADYMAQQRANLELSKEIIMTQKSQHKEIENLLNSNLVVQK
jgi:hypothetical protein